MTDGPADFLLYADRVVKTYPDGDVHALNGVTLGVRRGQHVAITGPSGCGKSTLLNLLGMLDRPDGGEVYFRGEPLSAHARPRSLPRPADRVRVPVVLPDPHAHRARERAGADVRGAGTLRPRRAAKADDLLALVGMGTRAGHRPQQLSVGERQRVALARALANDPVMLLADEPTGNLDSDNAAKVLDLFASLQKTRNLALLVVTHSDEVAERADRVIRMKDGRVLSDSGADGVPISDPAASG